MQLKPDHDHVAAAETVVEWASVEGGIRNRSAGVLLAAALKAQPQDVHSRALRWAKRVLPDEIPVYVAMAVARIAAAHEPVTRNSVSALLRRQGRDRASFVDCPDCPDVGRCDRCFGTGLLHRAEVSDGSGSG
jgi:hypothetical protein